VGSRTYVVSICQFQRSSNLVSDVPLEDSFSFLVANKVTVIWNNSGGIAFGTGNVDFQRVILEYGVNDFSLICLTIKFNVCSALAEEPENIQNHHFSQLYLIPPSTKHVFGSA
jgi:hypothetical protein